MLTVEKNRRANGPKVLHRRIDEHIRWLEKRLSGLDDELAELIRDTPLWRERDELLRSVPGALEYSAHAPARTGKSRSPPSPAWRNFTASGDLHGSRCIWGGRAQVRRVLDMATVSGVRSNPAVRTFYLRLRANGKHAKSASSPVCSNSS